MTDLDNTVITLVFHITRYIILPVQHIVVLFIKMYIHSFLWAADSREGVDVYSTGGVGGTRRRQRGSAGPGHSH